MYFSLEVNKQVISNKFYTAYFCTNGIKEVTSDIFQKITQQRKSQFSSQQLLTMIKIS